MLGLKGTDEAGFDIVPFFLVNLENLQRIPPSLGLASGDAGQLLDFLLAIPGSDVGSSLDSLDESVPGCGVLAFTCMK